MSKKRNKAKKQGTFFVRFMAVIWSLIIVIALIDVYRINNYNRYRYYDPEYTIREIIASRYISVYDEMLNVSSRSKTIDTHHEYSELMAIKNYIGAKGQYKIYEENNMPEKAAYYKAIMDEAEKGFGKLDFAIDEIDKMFE